MQINRGRIRNQLQRRRSKSARSIGLEAPSTRDLCDYPGRSALDALVEPRIKSADVHDETDAALISGCRLTRRMFWKLNYRSPAVRDRWSGHDKRPAPRKAGRIVCARTHRAKCQGRQRAAQNIFTKVIWLINAAVESATQFRSPKANVTHTALCNSSFLAWHSLQL